MSEKLEIETCVSCGYSHVANRTSEKPEVKVGQVYRDKDKRMEGGHALVTVVAGSRACAVTCLPDGSGVRGRVLHLSVKNLQVRFELVKDV